MQTSRDLVELQRIRVEYPAMLTAVARIFALSRRSSLADDRKPPARPGLGPSKTGCEPNHLLPGQTSLLRESGRKRVASYLTREG